MTRLRWLAHDSTIPETEYFETREEARQWLQARVNFIAIKCFQCNDSLPCELFNGGAYVAEISMEPRIVPRIVGDMITVVEVPE